jgi:hypothetical protein
MVRPGAGAYRRLDPDPGGEMIDTDARTENERRVRAGYEAFGAGDLAAVQELFDPKVVWHVERLGVLAGDHEGWPAIAEFFGKTKELTNGTFTVTVEEMLSNETGVAAVVRSRAERNGKRLDDRQVHLFRLEDGRAVEIWQYPGVAADDFWS